MLIRLRLAFRLSEGQLLILHQAYHLILLISQEVLSGGRIHLMGKPLFLADALEEATFHGKH
jgi:hypothetical protein